jgi:hypothetical protein
VLKPDNGPQLPVQVQHHAVLQIICRRHESFFLAARPMPTLAASYASSSIGSRPV